MAKKLEIGIGLVSVVVALAAWLFPVSSLKEKSNALAEDRDYKKNFDNNLLSAPSLIVSGTGAQVKILVGPDDISFTGGEVSKTGAVQTIYIKSDQKIDLKITGTGAKVFIQSSLIPYIRVSATATGGVIYEL